MYTNKLAQPIHRPDFHSVFRQTVVKSGFLLTAADRQGIAQLLALRGTRHAPNPALLEGLLRHKLRIAEDATAPAPQDLVVAGSHVTYLIPGRGARSGTLTMNSSPIPGHILVASLLGATLIGMRMLQKVPLLRDDGQIASVVVLDVSPADIARG